MRLTRRTGRPRRASRPWRRALDIALTIALLGLGLVFAARLDGIDERALAGRATVNDGDSLTIAGERIRLRGIDAPELDQTCRRDGADYPCGRRARDALVRLLAGSSVACTGWEHDRYGRLLAECEAGGTQLNRALVEQGWAVAYGGYGDEEAQAREAGRGLWAGGFERPRDWRVTHGGLAEMEHGAINRIWNWLRQAFRAPSWEAKREGQRPGRDDDEAL